LPLPPYPWQGRRYPLRVRLPAGAAAAGAPETPAPFAVEATPPRAPTAPEDPQTVVRAFLGEISQAPSDGLASDVDLRQTLNLDSLALMELKGRLSGRFPGASLPIELFLRGPTITRLCAAIAAAPAVTARAVDPAAMMAALVAWSGSADGERVRADRRVVHKRDPHNVLVGDLGRDGAGQLFFGEMLHNLAHPFFYEHEKDHVPSMYLLEACKQFLTAVGHVYFDVPLDRPFIVESLDMTFLRFAETDHPVYFVALASELVRDEGQVAQVKQEVLVIQDERPIARGRCLLHGFDPERYRELRKDRAQIDNWAHEG
jgi:hypothetical protein